MLKLCEELCLSHKCLYTASDEQLLADGYRANTAVAELAVPQTSSSARATAGTPSRGCDTTDGRDENSVTLGTRGTGSLLIETPPHNPIPVMLGHIKQRSTPPLHSLTLLLFDAIAEYELLAKAVDGDFRSPIWEGRSCKNGESKPMRLKEWGEYAVKQQCKVAAPGRTSKRQKTVGSNAWDAYVDTGLGVLEHLYEAGRLLIASKQEGLELSMLYLDMVGVSKRGEGRSGALRKLAEQWGQACGSFTRAQHLQEVRTANTFACIHSRGARLQLIWRACLSLLFQSHAAFRSC